LIREQGQQLSEQDQQLRERYIEDPNQLRLDLGDTNEAADA